MNKVKIIDENSERNILQERLFLSKMYNPFIVNMLCSFQDKDNIYLVLQLFTGGDLRYHLTNYIYSFTETQLKFLFSNIILALQYIHSKGIIHRDLKPENILFDDKGYAYITDFGIAWSINEDHEGDNSGTPGYMAPEALFGRKQNFCVDFYSLGVIGYEIIMGKTPYEGNSRQGIQDQMQEKNVYVDINDIKNYSNICVDFINGLLSKNPKKRLGNKSGISEIKSHSFFRGLNWELIYLHKYLSPIYDIITFSKVREGETEELFDVEYCGKKENIGNTTLERYDNIKNGKYYSKYFMNYSFLCVDNILNILPKKKIIKIIRKEPVNDKNNVQLINNNNLRRSQSINNIIYPNINDINRNYNYKKISPKKINDKKKYLSRSAYKKEKARKYYQHLKLQLPYIKNKILKENAKREKKIKGYYENKLLKYKSVLKILHHNYIKKARELKDKYKVNKVKGFKILYEKNQQNLSPQPINFQEIQNNLKNIRYNNYDAFNNQNSLIIPNNNNPYLLNNNNYNNYGFNSNNNCNCGFNYCYNNGQNINCNSCNCNFDMNKFLDKVSMKKDNFFMNFNKNNSKNDYYNKEDSSEQTFYIPMNGNYQRSLYDQNLIERQKMIPQQIIRNKIRYITQSRNGDYVEVIESSTDEKDEEEEEYEVRPKHYRYNRYDETSENQKIKYKPKKDYESETRYYTKIIKVHKQRRKTKKEKENSKKEKKPDKDKKSDSKEKKDKNSEISQLNSNKNSSTSKKSKKKSKNKEKESDNKEKEDKSEEEDNNEEEDEEKEKEEEKEEEEKDENDDEEGENDENEDEEGDEEGEKDDEEGENDDEEGENDDEEGEKDENEDEEGDEEGEEN